MDSLFMGLIIGLVVVIFVMLYRVFEGPSVYDRLNGLGVIGTDTILLLVLIGYIDKRPDMFVDIAISYAILGFISLVVIAKYIGGKGDIKK
ncbi:MAG: pH regulation protein F [Clostridiaceae bacterium BRH_c20a]|nr:MAG: pH regulation protein F [Clostridiaceae bacterium BRH_c20a]